MDKMSTLLERLRPAIERIGGGGDDGEELFAEVALACVEKRAQYDWEHAMIEGRVIRIAQNLRVKRLRRERLRKHERLPSDDCHHLACHEPSVDEIETQPCGRCQLAVETLPQQYREVIHEHFVGGKRLVAIARAMKVPAGTIRTRYHRALERLARDPQILSLAEEEGIRS